MYIVIFVTASDKDEAEKISNQLVEDKLVACVNIVDGVASIFRWKEKVDKAGEALLIMKTKQVLFSQIAETIKSLHSYTVPEIIAFPIVEGSEDYLKWVDGELKEN
ncbi:Periplasmic divalent cation tolerance protein CutA [hydrothermal vent metagenome]|uniref:Periplasmic divalent cation tolerance protein CutA n=1 Tax=hydrothermal vent metagenome TaxID=652676 RepID=A0A3B1CX05_9ZZZZ